jgi:LemA protein
MLPIFIVAAVLGFLGGFLMTLFNKLTHFNNRAKNALSDIDVQLKRRYDLVPNLVETVKGYAKHEEGVFSEVTNARTQAMGASQTNVGERVRAESALSGALKTLLAVAEGYPELKASENFKQLQAELATLENDISSARRYYNAAVREMNNAVQVFPANMFAGLFSFRPLSFFGAEEGERNPVEVSFEK